MALNWLSSPRFRLICIELLVLLGVAAMFLLVILGAYRRRSSNKFSKFIVWASYTASYLLESYTLGLMRSSPSGNGLFSVWAICLFMFLCSADSITAYSLEDNDQWKRFWRQILIQTFWLGWVLATFTDSSDFKILVYAMDAVVVVRSCLLILSFRLASNDGMLSEITKCIADYLSYEHEQQRERDPVTLRGYLYVVAGEDELRRCVPQPLDYLLKHTSSSSSQDSSSKLVTVERIWECKGSLLQGERGRQFKDLCLSMALSKMLNRRFAGFEVTEPELRQAREFLLDGLLLGNSNSYEHDERALRVVEAELALVHDYFNTKYHTIYVTGPLIPMLSLIMFSLCILLSCQLWHHFRRPNDGLNLIAAHHRNYDALLTFVVVVGMALIELFQLYLYLASTWFKVALISRYAVRASWQSRGWITKLIGYIVRLKFFRYWEDCLGQYTLLQSFDHESNKIQNALHCLTGSLLFSKGRKGERNGKPVRISREIKQAVLKSLKKLTGHLSCSLGHAIFQLLRTPYLLGTSQQLSVKKTAPWGSCVMVNMLWWLVACPSTAPISWSLLQDCYQITDVSPKP